MKDKLIHHNTASQTITLTLKLTAIDNTTYNKATIDNTTEMEAAPIKYGTKFHTLPEINTGTRCVTELTLPRHRTITDGNLDNSQMTLFDTGAGPNQKMVTGTIISPLSPHGEQTITNLAEQKHKPVTQFILPAQKSVSDEMVDTTRKTKSDARTHMPQDDHKLRADNGKSQFVLHREKPITHMTQPKDKPETQLALLKHNRIAHNTLTKIQMTNSTARSQPVAGLAKTLDTKTQLARPKHKQLAQLALPRHKSLPNDRQTKTQTNYLQVYNCSTETLINNSPGTSNKPASHRTIHNQHKGPVGRAQDQLSSYGKMDPMVSLYLSYL